MGHVLCPETLWRLQQVIFPWRLISTLGLDLNPARASIQPVPLCPLRQYTLMCPHLQFTLIFTENIEKGCPSPFWLQKTVWALCGKQCWPWWAQGQANPLYAPKVLSSCPRHTVAFEANCMHTLGKAQKQDCRISRKKYGDFWEIYKELVWVCCVCSLCQHCKHCGAHYILHKLNICCSEAGLHSVVMLNEYYNAKFFVTIAISVFFYRLGLKYPWKWSILSLSRKYVYLQMNLLSTILCTACGRAISQKL